MTDSESVNGAALREIAQASKDRPRPDDTPVPGPVDPGATPGRRRGFKPLARCAAPRQRYRNRRGMLPTHRAPCPRLRREVPAAGPTGDSLRV